jgi:hypothetical protein
MKRDIDLARQLLLDIENRGADCSVSVLRTGPNHEAEERVRYHLRLLIDAGLLKEIDRTTNGVPCLRLTDAGHEMIELTRSEGRWREAKWTCHERTGGQSLLVIRNILMRWALHPPRGPEHARYSSVPAEWLENGYRGRRSVYRFEPYVETVAETAPEEEVRYVRVRPANRTDWRLNGVSDSVMPTELATSPTLPEFLL